MVEACLRQASKVEAFLRKTPPRRSFPVLASAWGTPKARHALRAPGRKRLACGGGTPLIQRGPSVSGRRRRESAEGGGFEGWIPSCA